MDLSLAEEYALKALEIAKKKKTSLSTCYYNLCKLYRKQNRLKEAYDVYILNYEWRKRQLNNNEYTLNGIASAARSLGKILYDMGRYKEAVSFTEEAEKCYRTLVGRNPLSFEVYYTGTMHDLGQLYEKVYDYVSAENAYREAYNRRKASIDRDDVFEHEVIVSGRALAYVLTILKKFEEAEALYRNALELSLQYAESNDGNEGYVRSSKHQLASNCLTPLGKYDEAEKLLESILIDYQQKILTEQKLDIDENMALYLSAYASMLGHAGRAAEGIEMQKKALSYYEKGNVGTENPIDYSVYLHNTAWLLVEAGFYEEALPYIDKELDLREHLIAEEKEGLDYYIASTYQLRGECYVGVGKTEEAEQNYSKALHVYELLYDVCADAFSSNLAEMNLVFAKLKLKEQDYTTAIGYCKKAIDFYTELEKKASSVYQKDLTDAYDTYVAIRRQL